MHPCQFLLGLGGNLGDRVHHINQAILKIKQIPGLVILDISEAVDSDPVGYKDQGNFLNICLAVSYKKDGLSLLSEIQAIEQKGGRVRTIKDGPRTIDIDILFSEMGPEESNRLTLPHPRWRERGFVIIPLRQLLHSPVIAKEKTWDWLRTEVDRLNRSDAGLRLWQGPTPWKTILR
ncbi:2-amino-4-hydroxy-6-hydroxymethyldihydropteridine diphosphokinase [bacterium]|nr:2-amino-4-hydroxy-6-hydroxymethyldihydropteridine diphosphokinase [bacterium]